MSQPSSQPNTAYNLALNLQSQLDVAAGQVRALSEAFEKIATAAGVKKPGSLEELVPVILSKLEK